MAFFIGLSTFVYMKLQYSFVIPVYNRPDEIKELLESFVNLDFDQAFEIVIVEDGSSITSEKVVESFSDKLNIIYYYKSNSGPGDSRNFGMRKATGNYYIILDSDCILPPSYLKLVDESLQKEYVDCYGGPDNAHSSFSLIQQAINFSMTSVLTTGGIRGNKHSVDKFQPRSFNMGLSKKAFLATNGFGRIHPGEDPDLSIRLWKTGFKTKLISNAFVYHKRRISWSKFFNQVYKFGKVRPILNLWHPETKKITYWFPFLFVSGFLVATLSFIFLNWFLPLFFYGIYFTLIFISALIKSKNLSLAGYSIIAASIQFYGYGLGFIKSIYAIRVLGKAPEDCFPELFFNQHV